LEGTLVQNQNAVHFLFLIAYENELVVGIFSNGRITFQVTLWGNRCTKTKRCAFFIFQRLWSELVSRKFIVMAGLLFKWSFWGNPCTKPKRCAFCVFLFFRIAYENELVEGSFINGRITFQVILGGNPCTKPKRCAFCGFFIFQRLRKWIFDALL